MIGRALKVTREFHRMKQFELAQLLDISPSFLSEIESGLKAPSIQLLEKYGRIFKVPPSTFLLFVEKAGGDTAKPYSTKNADRLLKFLEWVIEEDVAENGIKRAGSVDEKVSA